MHVRVGGQPENEMYQKIITFVEYYGILLPIE